MKKTASLVHYRAVRTVAAIPNAETNLHSKYTQVGEEVSLNYFPIMFVSVERTEIPDSSIAYRHQIKHTTQIEQIQ